MVGKIIGHIVGLPNNYKNKFLDDLKKFPVAKNNEISIIDLDDITMQIISDKNIILLYNKLDELNEKKKINKPKALGMININKTIKDMEQKINEFWKTKIDNHILKEINKNKNIICIGLSTYFKNHKIGIKIVTPNKLFIKLNLFENAKQIINNNLDTQREAIVNGIFDLNYLDINFLVRKREDLQNTYEKMSYQLKSYNDISKIIQLSMHNVVPSGLYFVDYKEFSKTEIKKKKNIIGYTSEWLAIISILKDKIIKGYDKSKKPYIKEIEANILEKLYDPLYLYYTTDIDSFMPEITNSSEIYKYVSTRPILKFTHILMDNPYDKLIKIKVKMIKFKNK